MSVQEKMTAIADAIRAKTGDTGKLGLDAMAAAVPRVYDGGYTDGYTAGQESQAGQYAAGFADGKQAENDRFWDVFQQNGNLRNYDCAFGYGGWNDAIYNPKYDIITEGDTAARQTFYAAKWLVDTKVPIYINRGRLVMTFYQATALKTIPYLYIAEAVNGYNNPFGNCLALEDITLGGVITMSVSFAQSSKLTRASIESIVGALSPTAAGQVLTLSQAAVDIAFDSDGSGAGHDTAEWGELCDSKPNWTITLV